MKETTVRYDLLQEARAWLGLHYQEGDDSSEAWATAVHDTLGIPPLTRALVPRDWRRPMYDRALTAFGEIATLGMHYDLYGWPDTAEAQVCKHAWAFVNSIHQPDLTRAQLESSHIEAMVRGITHWLTFVEGGLADTTQALDRAFH
ncbi:MAG: hypothetical protein ABIQ39_05885 [Ilumatobacteraceae bacterium]